MRILMWIIAAMCALVNLTNAVEVSNALGTRTHGAPFRIAADSNGNLYLAGDFSRPNFVGSGGFLGLNGVETETGSFLCKYKPDGTLEWLREIHGNNLIVHCSAVAIGDEVVYAAGEFSGTLPNGVTSHALMDAFVVALDSRTGAPLPGFGIEGFQTFGGTGNDLAQSIALNSNTLYVSGNFNSSDAGIGGPGNAAATSAISNVFILALDPSSGAAKSAFGPGGFRLFESPDTVYAGGLVANNSGLFVAGSINKSTTSTSDIFITAMNLMTGDSIDTFGTNGVKLLLTSSNAYARDLSLAGGNLYVSGLIETQDGTSSDVLVAAINAGDGNFVASFGSSGMQLLDFGLSESGLALHAMGERIFIAGYAKSIDLTTEDMLVVALDRDSGVLAQDFAQAGIALIRTNHTSMLRGTGITSNDGLVCVSGVYSNSATGTLIKLSESGQVIFSQSILDSDSDFFPDEVEVAFGTDPQSAASSPIGGSIAALIDLNSGDLKTESNLKIKARLTFTNAAKDTLTFTGGIPIAENSLVDKQVISVDIGGVIRSFTLDAKGRAKTGSDSLKLRVKTANNVVSAQIAKFNIKVSNADFDTLLADEGLTGNSDLKHVKRQIPSYIFYVQYVYRALVIVDYSAKVRKTGVAK